MRERVDKSHLAAYRSRIHTRLSALYDENDAINERLDEYKDIEQQLDGREPY
jgi:hypothetical protein